MYPELGLSQFKWDYILHQYRQTANLKCLWLRDRCEPIKLCPLTPHLHGDNLFWPTSSLFNNKALQKEHCIILVSSDIIEAKDNWTKAMTMTADLKTGAKRDTHTHTHFPLLLSLLQERTQENENSQGLPPPRDQIYLVSKDQQGALRHLAGKPDAWRNKGKASPWRNCRLARSEMQAMGGPRELQAGRRGNPQPLSLFQGKTKPFPQKCSLYLHTQNCKLRTCPRNILVQLFREKKSNSTCLFLAYIYILIKEKDGGKHLSGPNP